MSTPSEGGNASEAPQGRVWAEMTAGDFGRPVQPVQGALFAEPDEFGTLDLFDSAGE